MLTKAFLFFLLLTAFSCSSSQCNKTHLAFYYTWYRNPQVSGYWSHWNSDGHNPEVITGGGLPDIAAARHPRTGLYDSTSDETIQYHVELARKSGINGFILSWWGKGMEGDNQFNKLLNFLEKSTGGFYVAGYYERLPENDINKAIDEIQYFVDSYTSSDAYLKINGEPVLFVYGRAIFPLLWCLSGETCVQGTPLKIDWSEITSHFQDIFFIADIMTYAVDFPMLNVVKEDGFKGVHVYNPLPDLVYVKSITSAYYSFVKQSKMMGLMPFLTVIPGYDDTHLLRKHTSYLDREDGRLYSRLLKTATELSDEIIITSFNEWHEGTEIEPSVETGDKYLDITSRYLKGTCSR